MLGSLASVNSLEGETNRLGWKKAPTASERPRSVIASYLYVGIKVKSSIDLSCEPSKATEHRPRPGRGKAQPEIINNAFLWKSVIFGLSVLKLFSDQMEQSLQFEHHEWIALSFPIQRRGTPGNDPSAWRRPHTSIRIMLTITPTQGIHVRSWPTNSNEHISEFCAI